MTTMSISNSLITQLKPKAKQYDVRDGRLKGFMIRVQPTGNMTYAVQYARGERVTLGKVGIMTPAQAREKAVKILGEYASGSNPKNLEKERRGIPTLRDFLDNDYGAWVKTHNISGEEAIKTIERHFDHLLDTPLDQIKAQDVEKWRTRKLESKSIKANTINRTVTPLRSAITKAVEWGFIKEHGLSGLKILKYDDTRIRFLSEDEKSRLFEALNKRDQKLKEQRQRANQWREQRGYECYPEMKDDEFAAHLMPMVILALNTGVRRGELLRLKRTHINLEKATLFVEKSKNYLARYVPLNKTAVNAISIWLQQTSNLNSLYLFPSPFDSAKPIGEIKKAWGKLVKENANIQNLRWHDLRHDFASNLVMEEVSLYAVQKLMGHKKIDQTMKYAHLAPEYIAESVGRLDK